MKKLRLSALELGAKEVLSRDQLKKVLGGGASGCSVSVTCSNGETISCSCSSGTCSAGDGAIACTCELSGSGSSGTEAVITGSCPSGSGGSGGSGN